MGDGRFLPGRRRYSCRVGSAASCRGTDVRRDVGRLARSAGLAQFARRHDQRPGQLSDMLDALFAGLDGQIPAHVRPLVAALLGLPRPLSSYAWPVSNSAIGGATPLLIKQAPATDANALR
jgi:hypothetical protein